MEPDLQLEETEKVFLDPETNECHPFPDISMSPSLYMSLVVPAYKEQDRRKHHFIHSKGNGALLGGIIWKCSSSVPKMMKETMAYLQQRQQKDPSFQYEVIIVNDGSRDRTAEVALKFVQQYGTDKVRLLDFARNRGKGGAVRMVSGQ